MAKSKSYLQQLQDKTSYIHIFSALIQKPNLLTEYKLSPNDFPEKFHRVLFGAIYNLFQSGVTELSDVTIDGYLKDTPSQYKVFEDNRGIEYIDVCLERGEPTNFEYHYMRVKKFAVLRRYAQLGLDVEEIYNIGFQDEAEEVQQNVKFNNMTIEQIMRHFDAKIAAIKDDFNMDVDGYGGNAGANVKDILKRAMEQPNYGAPFQSGFYNAATRGARRRKFYCCSGNSGSGKSRKAIADLAYQTMPVIYDLEKGKWVLTGNMERGLFISTELEEDEIVIPLLCYIANVNEDKVQNLETTEEESARLVIASEILEKSHFYLEILFDFDDNDLTHIIQKYVSKYDVGYVFFDYLQTSTKMFESMHKRGAKGLQEHQLLRLLSVHLKNLCNRFNIWIGTATQLNDKFKEDGNANLDQSAIAGSKAIVDKLDVGAIQIQLRPVDIKMWESIRSNPDITIPFGMEPSHTVNIYKNRGNRWLLIRLWKYFDMGTLRIHDLFVTNYRGELVTNLQSKQFTFETDVDLNIEMSEEEVKEFIKDLENFSFEKEEYKDTKFDKHIDKELKRELQETLGETGIFPEEDDIDEVFPEMDEGEQFGEDKKFW